MENFTYCNPTKLVFGHGVEKQAGHEMAAFIPEHGRVMVVYGGGSAERSGLLQSVVAVCREAGFECITQGGVQPNPTYEFVCECTDRARAEHIDALLAVGGGSVIDTAKAVAAAVPYAGDVWDFFTGAAVPETALPVVAVLTLPASGSEQSVRCVITRGQDKLGLGSALIRPRAALINPELFFTLNDHQIATGVLDMMSHIMERYFTQTPAVDFTTEQAEAALRVIMDNGLKLLADRHDYDAWSQVGLAGSFAHNGFYGMGHAEDWACHGIEHALSGWNSAIAHGDGLAVIIPAWMRYVWSANPGRFVRFAQRVMAVEMQQNEENTVQLGIAKFCAFLQRMHLPSRLTELSDTAPELELIAQRATARGPLGQFKKLDTEDVLAILKCAE